MTPEIYKERLSKLEKQKDELEGKMSRRSKEYSIEKAVGRADCKSVSEVLSGLNNPPFLIEFAKTRFYDFKTNIWQAPHYLAFVLASDKKPTTPIDHGQMSLSMPPAFPSYKKKPVTLIDLGEANVIDGYVYAYRNEMRKGAYADEKKLSEISKALYKVVFEPISVAAGFSLRMDTLQTTLFISPDSSLNLIPFEVFMTPDGKYLIDEYQINYVSAGRKPKKI